MIDDLPFQIDRRFDAGVQAMVHGVAAGVETAADGDGVADVEGADGCVVNGRRELDLGHTGNVEC